MPLRHTLPNIFFLCCCGWLILSGCREPEVAIPFQTLDKGERGQVFFRSLEPVLLPIFTPQEISALTPYVSADRRERLTGIDFNRSLVIGVFQGWGSPGPREVIVDKVVSQNDTLKIYATFLEAEDISEVFHPAPTSPYEIIIIEKPRRLAEKNVTFILMANRKKVAQQMYKF